MSAPAGLCGSCGMPMEWTFIEGELMVRCETCTDLFAVDGMEVAGVKHQEGGDGGTVTMLEEYYRALLAGCEESCTMRSEV